MGIQGLTPFLKKHAPTAFSTVSLAAFSQKKIAIDISLFLYKYKIAFGDHWLSGIINMFTALRENGIHPVVIFDGEAPVEKIEEQKNRRLMRDERNNKYDFLMARVENYTKTGQVCDDLKTFHDKQVVLLNQNSMLPPLAGQEFNINLVVDKLSKIKNQNVKVTYVDLQIVQELLNIMCIHSIQAPAEAEALGSWLCVYNIVDAIMTEDTDVLAYATPKFLNKINISSNTCTLIEHEKILSELELTKDQFVDFCIMCGCDYNNRVKGVGPIRIHKLLKKHKSIPAIVENETKYDFGCLNATRVREMFTTPDHDFISAIDGDELWSNSPCFDNIEEFINKHGCNTNYKRVYNACLQDARTSKDAVKKNVYKKRTSPSHRK